MILLLMAVSSLLGLVFVSISESFKYPRLTRAFGAFLAFGVPILACICAMYMEAKNPPVDPWECTHTHVERQCRGVMIHHCGPVDVCDEKKLRKP